MEAMGCEHARRTFRCRRVEDARPGAAYERLIVLTVEETQIVELVAKWVDGEVRPVVNHLEHANTYPEALIEQMKQMGVYGLAIPAPYGDFAVSARCYVQVTEEIARGWMSLAGAFGGHSVVSKLIMRFGTDDQKEKYLPL